MPRKDLAPKPPEVELEAGRELEIGQCELWRQPGFGKAYVQRVCVADFANLIETMKPILLRCHLLSPFTTSQISKMGSQIEQLLNQTLLTSRPSCR